MNNSLFAIVAKKDYRITQFLYIAAMGRPPTKPKKLKDGFYVEVRNIGSKSGIKIRRDDEVTLQHAIEEYERTKEVIILGELINGKWQKESRVHKPKK